MNDTTETNRQLIRQAQTGEADAFAVLVERYRSMVFKLCLSWTRNRTDADDLTQETLLRAYARLTQMRDPDRFGVWLAQIAVNLCKNWRSRGRQNLLPLCEAERQTTEPDIIHGILLRQAMATLTPEVRQAVEWFYVEGFSQKEVAGLLQLPESTIKGRLDAGRLRLRREFQHMGLMPTDVLDREIRQLNVALTDVDPKETKALRTALKAAGYTCTLLKTQEMILPRLGALKPDLLILNTPFGERDENEIVKAMRVDPLLRDTPVMFLSPRNDKASIFQAWKNGVDVYLTNERDVRPFQVPEVIAFVDRVLSYRKGSTYVALAVEYAWRKQSEAALHCLDRALTVSPKPEISVARLIRAEPAFDYLRETPEFLALLPRLTTDEEWEAQIKEMDRKREEMWKAFDAETGRSG
jgi:RNA polymerase sigma-70 factor (ECF subfamily)